MGFSRVMFASGVIAVALVFAACKGGDASTPKQAGTATGEIVSARYDEVILKAGSAGQLRLSVDPSTQVVMDGRFVMVERLSEGTPVQATFDDSGKATRIEVQPKASTGAGGG